MTLNVLNELLPFVCHVYSL